MAKPRYWPENLERLPWVKRLKNAVQCQGWVASASFRRGKNSCKNPAYWKYTHSKRDPFAPIETVQYYCSNHVFSRGIGTMYEEDRAQNWYKKHGFKNRKGEWVPGTDELHEMLNRESNVEEHDT
jgi:hypothetical protein